MAMPGQAATLPQYDAIRRRLKNQYAQKSQEQTDAIQRRFASQGMAGSGAYGKAQDEAAKSLAREEADATGQLDFLEANELQRQREVKEGREFQTSERVGAQAFAKGERESAQSFNQSLFDKDMAFKQKMFDAEQAWKQIDNQFREKELEQNILSNKVSAVANFVGDDIDDFQKVGLAKDWVWRMFKPGFF